MKYIKSLRLMLLVVVAFGFTSVNPAKLSYVFKVGDTYSWVTTVKQDIKQSIMGMDQQMENNISQEMKVKVMELTKSGAKLEVQYVKMKTDVKSAMANKTMDSEGDLSNPENKLFKGMVDKPFYVFVTSQGKVEKVEGADTLTTAIRDSGLDEQKAAALKQSLEPYIGEAGLKSSLEQMFLSYPENQVKKGDTWKTETTTVMLLPIKIDNTWNITEMSESTVNLLGDGIFTTDKEHVMSLPGGMKAKMDLQGKQATKNTINAKTGWPNTVETLSELKGKMILLAGGPIPEDMEVPMEIVTESKTTITKK
jgi:hypothetical protein